MYTWHYIWSGSKEFDRLINSMANGNSKNWNKIMLLSTVCLCLHGNSQECQRSHFSYHTASRTHVTAKWRHHRLRVEIWNTEYLLKVTWLSSKLQLDVNLPGLQLLFLHVHSVSPNQQACSSWVPHLCSSLQQNRMERELWTVSGLLITMLICIQCSANW